MTKRFGLLLLILTLLLALPAFSQTARVQFIHNSGDIDARNVSVLVDGDTLLASFVFRTATPFMDVAAGDHAVEIIAGAIADTTRLTLSLTAGEKYAVIVNGITQTNLDLGAYSNPFGRDIGLNAYVIPMAREVAATPPLADVIAFHGATDLPAVDVVVQGTTTKLVDNRDYGEIGTYASVPPLLFILDVTDTSGTVVFGTFEANLAPLAGGAAVVFASGFADPSQNQSSSKLGVFGALPDGTVLELPNLSTGTPGPWQFAGLSEFQFTEFVGGDSVVAGGHGVAVDQQNRIWVGNFNSPGLLVLNPDGTQDASISPIATLTAGGVTVNATGCRGMAVEADGNILYATGANLFRIDPATGLATDHWLGGGSLLAPMVDAEGFIYTGLVVGINPVSVIDPLSFTEVQQITLANAPGFGRGIGVTGDASTIFTPFLTDDGGPAYIYRSTDLVNYPKVDSIFNNTDGDLILPAHIITYDWNPDSTLWISVDAAYVTDDSKNEDNGQYIFDFKTMTYKILFMPDIGPGIPNGPRGVAFTASGDTAYSVSWNGNRLMKFVRGAVSVEDRPDGTVPVRFHLGHNYPNPFNPKTTIPFTLDKNANVELKVFDSLGRLVKTVVDQPMTAGIHRISFDASDLASGAYHYRIKVNDVVQSREMILLK